MQTRPTVLVLGAAGRLGQSAVTAFARAGWRVLAQQRKPMPHHSGVTCLHTDLADTATLAAQSSGACAVVYGVNPPYHQWDRELLPLGELGMDLAERLQASFLLPGNVYGFGPGMPTLLQLDTPQPGGTVKGRQRLALEGALRQRTEAGRLRGVVIRAGDFYGGGRGNWFDQAIVKDVTKGRLVYPGPLDRLHAWAYLPDLALAFVAAARRAADGQAPAFETLHVAGNTWTGRQLLEGLQTAAAELGLRPARGWRHGGIPWAAMRVIGLVHPLMRELARMRYLWWDPHQLDGQSLTQALGDLPQTAPSTALRLALQDLGLNAGARQLLTA
jgi:nucleoside-diphosphate-sugar epimerase